MPQRSRNITYTIVCALALSWWGILNGRALRSPQDIGGQVRRSPTDIGGQARRLVPTSSVGKLDSLSVVGPARRSPLDVGGQTVPVGAGGAGTVPTRISLHTDAYDTLAHNSPLDSLEIEMLQIEIAKAEETVNITSFWRRILPQIHLSASFGIHDLMFIDLTSYTPYVLPRDAYRMTISLSLNEVLTFTRHSQAILDLQKLRAQLSLRMIQQFNSRKLVEQQLLELQVQSASLEKEISFIRELLHFNELRFQQGKIEFDGLTRSKLELSAAMRSLLQLHHQEALIKLKLSQ